MPIPIIHDGDHGGDDLITSMIALDRTDTVNLLGITTCFGNIPLQVASKNACLAIDFVPGSRVKVYPGSSNPWKSPSRSGDNAFGSNGLGGVELPEPETTPSNTSALEWMERILVQTDEPITLCPTGPMTNIARLLENRPDLKPKISRIVAMGGCLNPQTPHGRQGNITPFAEFNFYMDAAAADFVLNCGVPIVLFPLDVTHQLVFTKSRQKETFETLGTGTGEKLIQIMGAAANIDSNHFDLEGGVFHDECVLLYLLKPDLFRGEHLNLQVVTDPDSEHHGQLVQGPDTDFQGVLLINTLTNSDQAFDLILNSLKSVLKK